MAATQVRFVDEFESFLEEYSKEEMSENKGGHGPLSKPLRGCFCDDCCEQRYNRSTRTVKTKFNRNARY